jgi:AcrR family transcriptional regulator
VSPRLTRKERQANTRRCLLQSAAKVFCRRGLQQASIDEVADEAGYTKGAFYANFRNKEELFLAMLDQQFAERLEKVDRVLESGEGPEAQARQIGLRLDDTMEEEAEWQRLFFEFSAYAMRNEDFRQEFVTRCRALMARIAEQYRRRADELGIDPQLAPERWALMVFVMGNGVALQKLLEPEGTPHELYGEMMELVVAGLIARLSPDEQAKLGEAVPA